MKKLWLVQFVLVLAISACTALPSAPTPTPVPPLPTVVPPTEIPPTPIPPTPTDIPTAIPPTPEPPTAVPPTAIPPTAIPPTEVPTENRGFFPGVVSGSEVVFEEDFSDPKLDWPASSGEEVKRAFVNGEFLMSVIEVDWEGWNYVPNVVYSHDVVLDVDVRGGINLPEDSVVGFVCGFEDNENFYGMAVGPDGWMEFIRYKNDERERLYSSADVIPLDSSGTHLTGVCTQTELSLYANWQLVATYAIDSLPAGSAGLLGGSYDTGNVELYFDNFIVSKGPYVFTDGMNVQLGRLGERLLKDNFSDENSGWDVRTTDEGDLTAYVNDEYRMKVNSANYDMWSNPNDFVNNSDVIVDVDVRMGSNPGDSAAAVICNYNMSTHGDFTVAAIDGAGYAQIYEYVGGEINVLFISETPLKLNPQVNHLTAHCLGSSVTLLVNNQIVGTATSNVSSPGNVGLLSATYEKSTADFYYDNFVVYSAR
ncbi:MAG: hypothetical protein WBI14_00160 [Anaerolineaceae bacterium]